MICPLIGSLNIVLLSLVAASYGAKIFALFPVNLTSHYIIFDSIMTELAVRGHDVTVVNSFPKKTKVQNFTDVDVSDCVAIHQENFEMQGARVYKNTWRLIRERFVTVNDNIEPVLTCPSVQEFKFSNKSFDLVITEIFGGDLMLGIANQFRAPIVSFCAGALYQWGLNRMGSPFNPSYMSYPHTDLPLDSTDLTFYSRLYNTLLYLYASMWYHFYGDRVGDAAIRKYIDPRSPSLFDIAKSTSLVLAFSHFSLNRPIPLVPNVVEIAGVHINDPKPLPQVCLHLLKLKVSFTIQSLR